MKKAVQIYRLDTSPYQGKDFTQREGCKLSKIQGVVYRYSREEVEKGPIILLTNTHSEVQTIVPFLDYPLSMIVHSNSGYDNFTLDFVKRASFPILLGNKIRAPAVIEYILSAVSSFYAPIPYLPAFDLLRKFDRSLLKNQHLLVIGYGEIGRTLVHILEKVVRKISIYDPYKNHSTLPSSLPEVDIIILTASLNNSSRNLLNSSFFSKLADKVFIINTARGELIEQKSLLDFLLKRPDSFCILDVFPKEPPQLDFFKDINNIKFTSHLAGVYNDLDNDIIKFESEAIGLFLEDPKIFQTNYEQYFLKRRIINNDLI